MQVKSLIQDDMKRLLDKYNATHEEQLPRITPHVL